MSVKVLKVNEPRMDIEADRTYIAMMGASNVSTRSYTASSANESSVIWSVTTPSVRVGMDRRIEMELQFAVKAVGANGITPLPLNPLLKSGNFLTSGLRQFPIHSIIEVLNVKLNDQAISSEPNKFIHALLAYGNDAEDRQNFMGSSPHIPDNIFSYSEPGNRSPFKSYSDCGFEDSRNAQLWITSTDNNIILFTLRESLMISPFYWGKQDYQALFGIQNFEVNLTLSNIKRILSAYRNDVFVGNFGNAPDTANFWFDNGGVAGINYNNLRVNINGESNQKLHITFLTPQPGDVVPRLLHYPYYQTKLYTQNADTLAIGGVPPTPITLNNITLSEIPKRCYIYLKQQPTNEPTQVDFFATITNVVISFDNQDGRLSQLDTFDLWKLSCKNGLKRSFVEWQKALGSVLCLEFGTDLNLNPLLAPGVRGNFQFSAQITYKDIRDPTFVTVALTAENIQYKLYVVMVPEGALTVEDQLVSISIGPLTQEYIDSAPFAPAGYRMNVVNYYGGSVIGNIWNGLKKAFKTAAPVVKDIAGVVGNVAQYIPHPTAQAVAVGSKAVNKALGGRKKGGALLRKSSLAHRL